MRSYIGPGTQMVDPHHTGTKHEMTQIDDGRWHHRFGASWLKTFDLCPERARLQHEGYDIEADAAATGTAVHSAIQYTLEEYYRSGVPYDAQTAVDIFHAELDAIEYEHVKWKTDAPPHKFGEICVRNWYRAVLPTLPPEARLEVAFVLPFYEDDERVIEMSGAIDYIDTILRDWKTSGRGPYEEWEYRRWAIQPTVYSWAATVLGLITMDDELRFPFEYVVLGRHGAQRFTVHRDRHDWEWLRDKVVTAALLIEAEIPEWPKQDNHALCSAKWCPAWGVCKGRYVDGA